jgi:hypothetical protein
MLQISLRTYERFMYWCLLKLIQQSTATMHNNNKHFIHHHHQPINVPTAGAHAFLMDYYDLLMDLL